MRINSLLFASALLFLSGIVVTSVRADDPAAGVWKVNPAQSTYNPGPGPKSATVTVTIKNNTETFVQDGVTASGTPMHATFTAKFDGTDVPVTGNPDGDTISLKRESPNHIVATLKKGGTVVQTVNVVVAADGKSRTATYVGVDGSGRKIRNVVFYDKQ